MDTHYVPSRFNVLSRTDDHGMILYNSYTGAIVSFSEDEKPELMACLKRAGITELDSDVKKSLYDHGFIVPGHVDQKRRALFLHESMHRTDMMHLILLVTEACNFRCTYCYEKFERGKMKPGIVNGVKALVKDRAGTLSNLHISWFGGEPLLQMPLIEDLSHTFLSIAQENQIQYSADVVTNGYFLTKEAFEKLLSWNVRQFMVTIDGVGEMHDRTRHLAGGGGTFDQIIENLRAVKECSADFDFTIRVNFDQENIKEVSNLIACLKRIFRT